MAIDDLCMTLPPLNTPLYNHPLHQIEAWLEDQGCERSGGAAHCWNLKQSTWKAEIALESDQMMVRYLNAGNSGKDLARSFSYALSRQDLQNAIFAGP
jgi:Protein of unknown function (DUF3143)